MTETAEKFEKFDVERLTLGEIAYVEDLSGLPISAIAEDDKPKGRALAAIAYVIKRRGNPKFTFHDAQQLTMAEVLDMIGDDEEDDADPKEPPLPESETESEDVHTIEQTG